MQVTAEICGADSASQVFFKQRFIEDFVWRNCKVAVLKYLLRMLPLGAVL
jgi:hypothetical protein